MKRKMEWRIEKNKRSLEGNDRLGRYKPAKFKQNKRRKRKDEKVA